MFAYGTVFGKVQSEPEFRRLVVPGRDFPRPSFRMRVAKWKPRPKEVQAKYRDGRLWIVCTCYDRLAERLAAKVRKGDWVYVHGELESYDLYGRQEGSHRPDGFRWGIKLKMTTCRTIPALDLDGMQIKAGWALVPMDHIERYKAMREHLGEGWVPEHVRPDVYRDDDTGEEVEEF